MPPRRPVTSTPSTPSKKRKVKHDDGNTSLDAFFRKSPQKAVTESATRASGGGSSSIITIEDDEAIAQKLAVEEGVDIEALRTLEQKRKSSPTSLSKQTPEIIDVDAIDIVPELLSSADTTARNGEDDSPRRKVPEATLKKHSEFFFKVREEVLDSTSFPDLALDPLFFSVTVCPWANSRSSNNSTPYSFLTHTLCSLSGTRSRIAILSILTNSLRCIIRHDPPGLLPALYLLSNSLAPPYVPIELGLGPSSISKAIQQVSGLTPAALKRLYTKYGDAGDVAFEAKSNLRTLIPHPALTVTGVYSSLLKICNAKGEGVTKQRQSIAEKLLVSAKGEEVRYLVRTMSQHIRVGAVRTSILSALAQALVLTRPGNSANILSGDLPYFSPPQLLSREESAKGKKKDEEDRYREKIEAKYIESKALLRRIYVQHPNFDHITIALLEGGLEELADKVALTVGIPLHPTLGSPTRSLDEVYDRLGNLPFTAEFKYDGQRAQIHARQGEDGDLLIRIFSRHLEEMTDKYPDIVALVETMFKSSGKLRSFIIDTEIVAIDTVDGSLRTFQELSNRARKDVHLEDIKISVCVFIFDLMFFNDESLLGQPFRIRRERLRTHFPALVPSSPLISRLSHVECCESEDGREAVEEFWQRSVESRSEGLMIKLLDSEEDIEEDADNSKGRQRKKPLPATYEPDKRTSAWLKLKKDYVLGLGDSLDLVPIGAWHGNGRKAAWWSPILLAAWDGEVGQLVAVCKCMSGFTDEFYKSMRERYPEGSDSCSRTSLWNVNPGGLKPTVYFKPQEVWEIRGADITISPVSVAARGLISQERGLSLRFPRFIRLREDKGLTDASTPQFLASMWKRQENRGKETKGQDDGDLIDAPLDVSEVEDEDEDD